MQQVQMQAGAGAARRARSLAAGIIGEQHLPNGAALLLKVRWGGFTASKEEVFEVWERYRAPGCSDYHGSRFCCDQCDVRLCECSDRVLPLSDSAGRYDESHPAAGVTVH